MAFRVQAKAKVEAKINDCVPVNVGSTKGLPNFYGGSSSGPNCIFLALASALAFTLASALAFTLASALA